MRGSSYPSHRSIEAWESAARVAGLDLQMVAFSALESTRYLTLPVTARNLLNPWLIARHVRSAARESDYVMLREFLAIPLLAAAPALWSARKKLLLIAVHNVQRAHRRWRDRFALRLLGRCGFRFVIPETSAGLAEVGLDKSRREALVLPLALAEGMENRPTGPKVGFRIGIVGRPRDEKSLERSVEVLAGAVRQSGLDATIVVGHPEGRVHSLPPGVLALDTSSTAAYRELLAQCRLVYLGYSREHYEYRTSGVILDAAAAHAAVVVPDFPVFRDQIARPCEIGATYRGESDLPAAIRRALALATDRSARFDDYLQERSAERIGEEMRRQLSSESPSNRAAGKAAAAIVGRGRT